MAERWIEAPVTSGAWEDLVASLRHQFGTNSTWGGKDTSTLGDAREWTHTAASGVRTTVTLSPREGRTLLRVVQEDAGLEDDRQMGWWMAAFLALLPSLLVGALVAETLAFGDVAGVVAVVLVMLAGVGFGGRRIAARVRAGRERQAERVQQVADGLADQVGGGRPQPAGRDLDVAPTPQLDLSVLEDEASETPPQPERQRTTS